VTRDDRTEKPYRTYRGGSGRRRALDDELAGLRPPKRDRPAETPVREREPRRQNPIQPEPQQRQRDPERPADGNRRRAPATPYRRYSATETAAGAAAPAARPSRDAADLRPVRRRFRWWFIPLGVLTAFVVAAVVFIVVMYPSFRRFDQEVQKSNERLGAPAKAQLTPDDGMLLRHATTVLLLGTDSREGEPARSDTIMLMRFDPHSHTVNQMSIPRDTRVQVEGHGLTKINEAMFYGGPALAIKTVKQYVGFPINHVMVVNFQGFPRLVKAVGGVRLYVPKTISTTAGSDQRVVTFTKGWHHLDGKNAMLYVRIRKVDSDFERAKRQQAFVQALEKKIAQRKNLTRLPEIGRRFMKGVATDLSTWQLMQIGFVKWRANDEKSKKLLLTGPPAYIGGVAYVLPPTDASKQRTIDKFLGQ
jgi:LCP family protein required for cell wall assembly